MDANEDHSDGDSGGYNEDWRLDEAEDLASHEAGDLGSHPLFRHWRTLDRIFWAPLWHEDSSGCRAAEGAFAQLKRWGAPMSDTGTHVAAMGYQCVALDGCILLRSPRDGSTERGDIEGAVIVGQQLLRLVCDIDEVDPPTLGGEDQAGHWSIEDLKRILAWQLEYRRPALEERLDRVRFVQTCTEANSIAEQFLAHSADVWPTSGVPDHLELVEDPGDVSVHEAMTVSERFDTARAYLYSNGDHLHANVYCPVGRTEHGRKTVKVTGAELRLRRESLCQDCAPSIHAALDAISSFDTPATTAAAVAYDDRRGPRQGQRLGDYLMLQSIANWVPSEKSFDPVAYTATVSGDELALLQSYWAELDDHGMISRIVAVQE